MTDHRLVAPEEGARSRGADVNDERVLILTSLARDARLAEGALGRAGLNCRVCTDIENLRGEIAVGAGAVLIAEEALPKEHFDDPTAWIGAEPPWSQLPLVVLTGGVDASPHRRAAMRRIEKRSNATFLQRPVPKLTLISTLGAAIESRTRQYVMRDLLEQQAAAAQTAREREARLRLALAAGDLGTWDWDLRAGQMVWDARQYDICGYAPDDENAAIGERFAEIVHPDDRAGFLRAIDDMLRNHVELRHDFRIIRPDGHVRWLSERGRVFVDVDGRPARIVGVTDDITERMQTEQALRESEARFRTMADGLPLIIWVHDADGHQQFVNQTFCEFFGVNEADVRGGGWRMLLHSEDEEAYTTTFLACVGWRRPFHAEARARNAEGRWRWLESWGRPRFSVAGDYLGFVGTSADVTERKKSEEQQSLLVAELQHRVKNVLATVQAISQQTLKGVNSLDDFNQRFAGRLQALARGHDVVLRSRWQAAKLSDLLRHSVEAYGGAPRIAVGCEEIWLKPAAALAVNMIIHELATNAAKYGALSASDGRVAIECRAESGRPGHAALVWTERGGPPVEPPAHRGFGSNLIERSAKHDLDGDAEIIYGSDGVRCVIRFACEDLAHAPG